MTAAVRVGLADRSYDVLIGRGLVDRAADHIAPLLRRRRVAVVMDETVRALHGGRLAGALAAGGIDATEVAIPPGEAQKSFAGLEALCGRLLDLELERGDLIVAFGGGVVGDLAGFAAAILKRGVDFVQIPTTLLAQVDSSVGGKTAIDAPQGKNLVGAFHQPRLVLADLAMLDTLPDRELVCGYAEVLKYGLLGDAAFFAWLEGEGGQVLARDEAALARAVRRSVEMKAEIVAEDEREAGRRALLNLGHTFAHALEAETGFDEALKHGEAVGLGLVLAFRFSVRLGLCPAEDARRAAEAVAAAGLPARLADLAGGPFSAAALVAHMAQDKKAEAGALTFVLARGIGQAFVAKGVEAAAVTAFLTAEGGAPVMAEFLALAPVLIGLLAVSAVFSAAETALTGASRNRMHQLERDGDRAAGRVNRLISNQERMIGAILLGANLINILASVLATRVLTDIFPGAWGVVISTGVMTILVLVFAEVLPKTLAILRSDDIARLLSGPTSVIVILFGPVVAAVQWLVRGTLRLVGVKLDQDADSAFAHEEIRGAVEYHHAEGLVEARDRRMLGGVLDLSELDVSEVMVHRRQIVMLDIEATPQQIVSEALESPFTRLPLYRHDPENVVGLLHAKDMARAIAAAGDVAKVDIAAIATEPWFIPETTNLKDQLNAFLKRRSHFALVVDEYGALQGLVTLEDIIEEIVGEIEDEHDLAIEGVRRQPDGSVVVDGQVAIRELNRGLDWSLPDEHAVTVAGLVIHEAQAIPEPGQTFIFYGHRFQVLRRQRNQITLLRVGPPIAAEET